MKYLKLLGWLLVYAFIFLFGNIIAGVLLGIVYLFKSIIAGGPLPLEKFIIQNFTFLLLISGVITLVLSFSVLLIRGKNPIKYLEFRMMSWRNTLLMALTGFGFAFFINSFMSLIRIDEFFPDVVTEPIMEMMTASFSLAFLAIGIVVPIYEEVLLRGLVFKELGQNMNFRLALLLQGLIFGLMHGNFLQFSYTFPTGILLGFAYYKYQSIFAPILIHLVWNSTSLLMSKVLPESNSPLVFILLLFFGAVLFLGGIIAILKSAPPVETVPDIPPEEQEV